MNIKWIKSTTSTANYIKYYYNSKYYVFEIEYNTNNKNEFIISILIKGKLGHGLEAYNNTNKLRNLNTILSEAEFAISHYLKMIIANIKKEARRVYEIEMNKIRKIENFILK